MILRRLREIPDKYRQNHHILPLEMDKDLPQTEEEQELRRELAVIRTSLSQINLDPLTYDYCILNPSDMECRIYDC
jgi:hypothetical protein